MITDITVISVSLTQSDNNAMMIIHRFTIIITLLHLVMSLSKMIMMIHCCDPVMVFGLSLFFSLPNLVRFITNLDLNLMHKLKLSAWLR